MSTSEDFGDETIEVLDKALRHKIFDHTPKFNIGDSLVVNSYMFKGVFTVSQITITENSIKYNGNNQSDCKKITYEVEDE